MDITKVTLDQMPTKTVHQIKTSTPITSPSYQRVGLVQWLRLLTLISADGDQFPAKAVVFSLCSAQNLKYGRPRRFPLTRSLLLDYRIKQYTQTYILHCFTDISRMLPVHKRQRSWTWLFEQRCSNRLYPDLLKLWHKQSANSTRTYAWRLHQSIFSFTFNLRILSCHCYTL